MKIKILYEDSNILVIDKPSGLSVHGDGKTKEKTLTDWVLKNYSKMKNVGEPMRIVNPHQVQSSKVHKVKSKENFQFPISNFITISRPGIVHRLDRDTSGVLVLAKNQKTYEFLKTQFSAPALELKTKSGLADRQDRVKKIYVAIVEGHFKNERGVINKPIGRSPVDYRRHLAGRGARGELRPAITEYKVIKNLGKFSYLEIKPKTGRTHQIRVHMKYLNHPVVCDSLYNPNGSCPKEISRLALHAKSIEFKDLKGEVIKVESVLPLQFKKIIK